MFNEEKRDTKEKKKARKTKQKDEEISNESREEKQETVNKRHQFQFSVAKIYMDHPLLVLTFC